MAGWIRVGIFESNDGSEVWPRSAFADQTEFFERLDSFMTSPGAMPESARLARFRAAMAPVVGMFSSESDAWMDTVIVDLLAYRPSEFLATFPETMARLLDEVKP